MNNNNNQSTPTTWSSLLSPTLTTSTSTSSTSSSTDQQQKNSNHLNSFDPIPSKSNQSPTSNSNSAHSPKFNRSNSGGGGIGAIGEGRKLTSSSPSLPSSTQPLGVGTVEGGGGGGLEAKLLEMMSPIGRGSGLLNQTSSSSKKIDKFEPLEAQGVEMGMESKIDRVSKSEEENGKELSAGGGGGENSSSSTSSVERPQLFDSNSNFFQSPPNLTPTFTPSTHSHPEPLSSPNTSSASSPSSIPIPPTVESLTTRISTLETTVSQLTNLLTNELTSVRNEIGLIRGLFLQSHSSNSTSGAGGGARGGGGGMESPLLTLRSPSPTRSTVGAGAGAVGGGGGGRMMNPFPIRNNLLPSQSQPYPTSPPGSSITSGFRSSGAAVVGGGSVGGQEDKDEMIRSLTSQSYNLNSYITSSSSTTSSTTTTNSPFDNNNNRQSSSYSPTQSRLTTPSPGLGLGLGLGLSSMMTTSGSGNNNNNNNSSSIGMGRSISLGSGSIVSMGGIVAGGGSGGRGGGSRIVSSTGNGFGAVGSVSSPNFEPQSSHQWNESSSSPMLNINLPPPSIAPPPPSSQALTGGGTINPPGSLGAKWEALGIGNDLFRTISKYGLGPPTKIQSKAIPCMLRNQDIVAQAPSIQERIQSYIVPSLQLVTSAQLATLAAGGGGSGGGGIQVLICTATVDQAAQASRLAIGLGSSLGIRTSLCVGTSSNNNSGAGGGGGGEFSTTELNNLIQSPPQILIGTPMKLLDLFNTGLIKLDEVGLMVIDECDQLIARNLSDFVTGLVRFLPPSTSTSISLSPNLTRNTLSGGSYDGTSPPFPTSARFNSSSPSIPSTTPLLFNQTQERQTAIFSCTVPQDVLNFASSLQLREPVRVLVRREGGESSSPSVRGLRQYYLYINVGTNSNSSGVINRRIGGGGGGAGGSTREWKLEALADLCEDYSFEHCVIFCSSVDAVEAITYKLGTRAIEALALVSDMGQQARHSIMSKFRSPIPNRSSLGPNKRCLVVYDALCRNLTDVHQVSLVINYDLPRAVEDYLHRIACATASGYGRPGVAINIVTPGTDVDMLRSIESYYRCKIAELPPSFASA